MKPQKRLLTQDDMNIWSHSETFNNLISFLSGLAESVKGLENNEYQRPTGSSIESCCQLLEEVASLAERYPVKQDAETSRFGKVEFRYFYDDLKSKSQGLIQRAFDALDGTQCEELSVYFAESWGDRSRIDYGSGHELNFLCFLYGLKEFGVFKVPADYRNMVLKLFIKYLGVMRTLETKYWLEPAGSHGVWGLDDYHFLPFLFGAFQLSTHKHLKPKSIHNSEVVEMFGKRYLYFGCIDFINKVKTTASLRWHSPMLDDISGVKTWAKVAEGMIKMYKAEVLNKLPIMQHFFFGSFLQCPEGISPPGTHAESHQHCSHSPLENTWGDCCGIRVPSAVAATESQKAGPKRIPFD